MLLHLDLGTPEWGWLVVSGSPSNYNLQLIPYFIVFVQSFTSLKEKPLDYLVLIFET